MTGPLIRPGRLQDAVALAGRLRRADALEALLATGDGEFDVLTSSVALSNECWAAEDGGKVIAVGGVTFDYERNLGYPWLMGSDEMLKYPVTLVKVGREAVARWAPRCRTLMNYVHAENEVHIRWLKRIGFTMGQTIPEFGEGKAPFIHFYRES